VSDPRVTSHKGRTPDQLAEAGIGPGFVRLSCGIEDAEDLITDLEQALAR
jgi:cystathionine beta-lyase/cystathionine gamma-synthase